MMMHLDFLQQVGFFEVSQYLLPANKAVKPGLRAGLFIHSSVRIQYMYYRQMLAFRHFEVYRVMSRCNLDSTCAE